jgi:hypothetical protein
MKIPDTIFIRCKSPKNKSFLQEHISERVPIKNVKWVNYDDNFINWVHVYLNLKHSVDLTSKLCITLFILNTMIDENIEDALIIDDDIVFHIDWQYYFESIPDEYKEVGIINLGTSPRFNLQPKEGELYKLTENSGCESIWCSSDFAHGFLSQCNPDQSLNVILHGFLKSQNKPLLYTPITHSYSDLEKINSLQDDSIWISYIHNYTGSRKVILHDLLIKYDLYIERKSKIEAKFEELYGKKIKIKNVEYILNNDAEHKLNILDFQLNINSISDLP